MAEVFGDEDVLYVLRLYFSMFDDTTKKLQDFRCADGHGLLCVHHMLKISFPSSEWADGRVLIWKLVIKRSMLLRQRR